MSDAPTPAYPVVVRRFGAPRQKVAPFARFKGTSAWKKYPRRAREYAMFRAAANRHEQASETPPA